MTSLGFSRYMINKLGEVKALESKKKHIARCSHKVEYLTTRERKLTPQNDKQGYTHVILKADDGSKSLWKTHQLMAFVFFGYDRKRYNQHDVNSLVCHHIDGDKKNNKLSNLTMITRREASKLAWSKNEQH